MFPISICRFWGSKVIHWYSSANGRRWGWDVEEGNRHVVGGAPTKILEVIKLYFPDTMITDALIEAKGHFLIHGIYSCQFNTVLHPVKIITMLYSALNDDSGLLDLLLHRVLVSRDYFGNSLFCMRWKGPVVSILGEGALSGYLLDPSQMHHHAAYNTKFVVQMQIQKCKHEWKYKHRCCVYTTLDAGTNVKKAQHTLWDDFTIF